MSVDNKLPFLDVLVEPCNNTFNTRVYHKPTDNGNCMNGNSECTEKYKISVITNYLNRAYKVSKTWEDFHIEILHIKQRLINNNYTNSMVDFQIKKFLAQIENKNNQRDKNSIKVYYESQMHSNYEIEERVIKKIIYDNTKCTSSDNKLDLIFYYKNKTTSNLIMKNILNPPHSSLEQTNVIYEFTCPMSHSQVTKYIGFTQTTLSQRLTFHRQNGSICNHFQEEHHIKPTRKHLIDNTNIISKSKDRLRLAIKEALLILDSKPVINKQYDNFTNILKLHNPKSELKIHQPKHRNFPIPNLPSSPDNLRDPIIEQTLPIENSPSNLKENSEAHTSTEKMQVQEDLPFPLGPFSPRTHRLLTSPINVNSLLNNTETDTESILSQYSIPDLETILNNFGIENGMSQTSNVENIENTIMCDTVNSTVDIDNFIFDTIVEPSISQRIKTLRRDCRNSKKN